MFCCIDHFYFQISSLLSNNHFRLVSKQITFAFRQLKNSADQDNYTFHLNAEGISLVQSWWDTVDVFETNVFCRPVREALNCDILHFHKGLTSINFHHNSGQVTKQIFNGCLRTVEDMGNFTIQCYSLALVLILYLWTVF